MSRTKPTEPAAGAAEARQRPADEPEPPLRRAPPPGLDEAELRRRFALERRLADALREAPAAARPALYSEVYDAYFAALGEEAGAPDPALARLQRQLLDPFLSAGDRFLEIGAGDAELARALSEEGYAVTVVEASQESTSSAPPPRSEANLRTEARPATLRWVHASEAQSELEQASFDLAFSSHFVEHLHPDDLHQHLRDVLRWTRPGGRYVVVTPNRICGPHDVSGYFSAEPQGFHLCEYSFGELADALSAAGWQEPTALSGVGRAPQRRSLALLRLCEALLEFLGPEWRHRLYDGPLWRARRPFRPLEQVVVVARRGP